MNKLIPINLNENNDNNLFKSCPVRFGKVFKHKVDEVICVNCGKKFPRKKKGSNVHTNPVGVRPYGCKTCSKKCSREYTLKSIKLAKKKNV